MAVSFFFPQFVEVLYELQWLSTCSLCVGVKVRVVTESREQPI